jgi:hypothetical protein
VLDSIRKPNQRLITSKILQRKSGGSGCGRHRQRLFLYSQRQPVLTQAPEVIVTGDPPTICPKG